MELRLIDDKNDLLQLEPAWDELVSSMETPEVFFRFEWAKSFLKHFYDGVKPFVIVGYDNGKKPVAILPLCIERKNYGLKSCYSLHLITSSTTKIASIVDYCDVYIRSGYAIRVFLKKALELILKHKSSWDVLELYNFNSRSPVTFLLQELVKTTPEFAEAFAMVSEQHVVTPYFKLYQDTHFNHPKIRRVQRKFERLRAEHKVEVKVNQDFSSSLWQQFVALHRKRWGHSHFHRPQVEEFYRELLQDLAAKEALEFSYILIDGKLAAAHVGFLSSAKVYYYIPVFDEVYAQDGIGLILLQAMVEHYRRSRREFDFLRGGESYKFFWADKSHMNFNFSLVNRRLHIWDRVVLSGIIRLKIWARQRLWVLKLRDWSRSCVKLRPLASRL